MLKVDGRVVAEQKVERTIPLILQWDESLDIGSDTLTGVEDRDYQPPFASTGQLNKCHADDRPAEADWEEEKKLMGAQRNNKASE